MRVLIQDSLPAAHSLWTKLLSKAYPQAELVFLSPQQALLENVFYHDWSLLVVHPDASGMEGFDVLKEIKKRKQNLPILVISDLAPELIALKAIKAGASSFLARENLEADMLLAFQQLLLGKKYINNRTAEIIAASLENDSNKLPHDSLSDREQKVFHLIVNGFSIAEIGDQLQLSNNTISTYRTRILDKLNLSNNQELAQYAQLYKLKF